MLTIAAVTLIAAGIYFFGTPEQNIVQNTEDLDKVNPVGPQFLADSAYAFCEAQCAFGPRTMNSEAHEKCARWIEQKFRQYGCEVELQKADLKGYDGTTLHATNIIARHNPEAKKRILICAHWDSRPWADNDPDSLNWRKPVMAANDGASGVAVMLELARLIASQQGGLKGRDGQEASPSGGGLEGALGIDFVCFDAEDWGTPRWEEDQTGSTDSWALGAQYWAQQTAKASPSGGGLEEAHPLPERSSPPRSLPSLIPHPEYGILLDMVGGEGAQFYHEGFSKQYAPDILKRVWRAARQAGYGSFFPRKDGGMITDDHVPVNQIAGIPTIDIIPYYPDCPTSSFGPTWHTVDDTMEYIDRATLQAVGQTLIQVIYTE